MDLENLTHKIASMKKLAEEIGEMGSEFPAVQRNIVRILACIKMLEINVSDPINLEDSDQESA